MKSPAFDYIKAHSLEEVFDLIEEHGDEAKIIAGGQSLVPSMNFRLTTPSLLIDINGIKQLGGISLSETTLNIGALTRHWELEVSQEVSRHTPLLSQAVPHIAHEAIRSRGTFGGSIVHADPAAEFPACLLALGARLNLGSREGSRTIQANDFFKGLFETDLASNEILLSVDLDVIPQGYCSALVELERRSGDYATVGVVAHAKIEKAVFSDVKLVFFAVADQPVLATQASALLEGAAYSQETVVLAQNELTKDLDPLGDLHTSGAAKLHLAKVLTGRVLKKLIDQSEGRA